MEISGSVMALPSDAPEGPNGGCRDETADLETITDLSSAHLM